MQTRPSSRKEEGGRIRWCGRRQISIAYLAVARGLEGVVEGFVNGVDAEERLGRLFDEDHFEKLGNVEKLLGGLEGHQRGSAWAAGCCIPLWDL